MDFDLTTKSLPGYHVPMCYKMNFNNATIYINEAYCSRCENEININYLHMLEHELVEILSNKIRMEDGEYPIDVRGFDNLAIEWHEQMIKHECHDYVMMHWTG